jgi:cytochrome P450
VKRWIPNEIMNRNVNVNDAASRARICVGNLFTIAQILSALATLLNRYEFESIAPFEPRLVPVVTLRPSGPINLRVRPRKLD